MKLIGIKRVIILAVLITLNAVICAAYFLWVDPSRAKAQASLASMKSEISKLQGMIQNTKLELAEYQKNKPTYDLLKAKGFVSEPDRFQIPRDLDRVRQAANLGPFSFNVNVSNIQNPEAEEAKLKVFATRVSVKGVTALLDANIYNFLDLMDREFPDHLRVQSVAIYRKDKLDPSSLSKIAQKQPVPLLQSDAEFDWITAVPQSALTDEKGGAR